MARDVQSILLGSVTKASSPYQVTLDGASTAVTFVPQYGRMPAVNQRVLVTRVGKVLYEVAFLG